MLLHSQSSTFQFRNGFSLEFEYTSSRLFCSSSSFCWTHFFNASRLLNHTFLILCYCQLIYWHYKRAILFPFIWFANDSLETTNYWTINLKCNEPNRLIATAERQCDARDARVSHIMYSEKYVREKERGNGAILSNTMYHLNFALCHSICCVDVF